jgi:uncharacterized membrane protein YgaE (UPF0421/DUF939 family)
MTRLASAAARFIREIHELLVVLRQELAELQFMHGRGPQSIMTALAVALATAVALAVHADAVWWAAISGFVSTQATAPASIQRGILRVLGTTTGAALAVLLSPWLAQDTVALSLVLFVASTVGVLGFLVSSHGYAWLLSAITMDMVLLSALDDPLSALDTAGNRLAEVTIGTVAAILMALLMAPDSDVAPAPPAPGWSNLLEGQWAAVQQALRAGVGLMLVPPVWSWLELPSLSQTAITVTAVMAAPVLADDDATQQQTNQRSLQRLFGCLLGGVAGLVCLALSVERFLPWLLMLTAGIWISAHVQGSRRGVGYVGTQGAIVFICTLVQGWGPPDSVLPGVERFAGIVGGLLILLAVTWSTTSSRQPSQPVG